MNFMAILSICDLRVKTQGEIQTHQLWMLEYLGDSNFVWIKGILMPVPKLLNANCDLMKVTTNDLNVKCAIVQPFQSMWAFKLSCCIKTIGFLTSQKRLCSPRIYSSAEVHTSKLAMRIDLNQKACRIKDLLFGPSKEDSTYLFYVNNMYYVPVCVLFAAAAKVLFGNFLKVVYPPSPPHSRANSFLSRMSKVQRTAIFV